VLSKLLIIINASRLIITLERLRKERITIKERIRRRIMPKKKHLTRTLIKEIYTRYIKNIKVVLKSATTSDYRTLYYRLRTC
jgi:hypothetical protein